MMRKILPYYVCQLAGWGLMMLVVSLMPFGLGDVVKIEAVAGLVSTHLLRMVIIRWGWLEKPLVHIWPRVLVAVPGTCVVAYGIKWAGCTWLTEWTGGRPLAGVFDFALLLLPWAGIYFFYHEIQKSRQQCVRVRKLKQRIDVMQQQCEALGTDMESMMETLQRIGSLIEVDPDRSRAEITEFSRLLRTGYMR